MFLIIGVHMTIYRVSYKSMDTNNFGSIDVEADCMDGAICGVLRKYPQLIVFSADILIGE